MKIILIILAICASLQAQNLYRVTYSTRQVAIDKYSFEELHFVKDNFLSIEDHSLIKTSAKENRIEKYIPAADEYIHGNYNIRFMDGLIIFKIPPDSLILPLWVMDSTDIHAIYNLQNREVKYFNQPIGTATYFEGKYFYRNYDGVLFIDTALADIPHTDPSDSLRTIEILNLGDELFISHLTYAAIGSDSLVDFKIYRYNDSLSRIELYFDPVVTKDFPHHKYRLKIEDGNPMIVPGYLLGQIDQLSVGDLVLTYNGAFVTLTGFKSVEKWETIYYENQTLLKKEQNNDYGIEYLRRGDSLYEILDNSEGLTITLSGKQIYFEPEKAINVRYLVH